MASKEMDIVKATHQYDVGYGCGLEWAISLLDRGLNADEVRRLLQVKASAISDGLRAEEAGMLEDAERMKADFKREMMMESSNPP